MHISIFKSVSNDGSFVTIIRWILLWQFYVSSLRLSSDERGNSRHNKRNVKRNLRMCNERFEQVSLCHLEHLEKWWIEISHQIVPERVTSDFLSILLFGSVLSSMLSFISNEILFAPTSSNDRYLFCSFVEELRDRWLIRIQWHCFLYYKFQEEKPKNHRSFQSQIGVSSENQLWNNVNKLIKWI